MTDCAICLVLIGTEETVTTECGHVYHKICIADWCKIRSTCPSCRGPIHSGVNWWEDDDYQASDTEEHNDDDDITDDDENDEY